MKIILIGLIMMTGLLMSGCDKPKATEAPKTTEATEAKVNADKENAANLKIEKLVTEAMIDMLKVNLKDPDSVQLKDTAYYNPIVHFKKTGEIGRAPMYVLCGEINAKNSFGGYVGFKPFIVHYTTNGGEFVADASFATVYDPESSYDKERFAKDFEEHCRSEIIEWEG